MVGKSSRWTHRTEKIPIPSINRLVSLTWCKVRTCLLVLSKFQSSLAGLFATIIIVFCGRTAGLTTRLLARGEIKAIWVPKRDSCLPPIWWKIADWRTTVAFAAAFILKINPILPLFRTANAHFDELRHVKAAGICSWRKSGGKRWQQMYPCRSLCRR